MNMKENGGSGARNGNSHAQTVQVHEVQTRIRMKAVNIKQANERFEELRSAIESFTFREYKGIRYLYGQFGIGATANPASSVACTSPTDAADVDPHLDCTIDTSFNIVAETTEQAMARFDGFRAWLRELALRGHSVLSYVIGDSFDEPTAIVAVGDGAY